MSPVAGDRIRGLIVLLFIMVIAGCNSTPNDQSLLNPDTGKHAANWNVDHQAAFFANPSQCTECHGTDYRGGISNVSCFSGDFNGMSCHANGPSGHPADWALPTSHGASAKVTPSTSAMTGFPTCQICHGPDFTGGSIAGQTCLNTAGCHGATVGAPHSPAPWRAGATTHTDTYISNANACGLCHLGGRTPPSYAPLPAGVQPGCFNSTLCHGNTAAPHPVPFTDAALHGPAAKTDFIYCQGCHANPPISGAGTNPRFNVAIGSLANGCEDCHEASTAHPVPWRGTLPLVVATSHATAANMLNACALCHGATLGGGVGPACTSCHTAGSPLSLSNCTSCHGNPPDGTTYPNIAGQHAVHVAQGSYIICNTCHNGAGTGTLNHDYGGGVVNVAFLSAYNASSGAASFDATANTCANVSCHGRSRTQTAAQAGLTPPQSTVTQTPSWLTGAINVNTDCAVCHVLGSAAGIPENNSYYSGQHLFHFYTQGLSCTICHDAVDPLKLSANHFTHLDTAAMEGPASATIVSSLTLTYTPAVTPGTGTCVATCHASPTVPRNW